MRSWDVRDTAERTIQVTPTEDVSTSMDKQGPSANE
jgi:hypothetical protein